MYSPENQGRNEEVFSVASPVRQPFQPLDKQVLHTRHSHLQFDRQQVLNTARAGVHDYNVAVSGDNGSRGGEVTDFTRTQDLIASIKMANRGNKSSRKNHTMNQQQLDRIKADLNFMGTDSQQREDSCTFDQNFEIEQLMKQVLQIEQDQLNEKVIPEEESDVHDSDGSLVLRYGRSDSNVSLHSPGNFAAEREKFRRQVEKKQEQIGTLVKIAKFINEQFEQREFAKHQLEIEVNDLRIQEDARKELDRLEGQVLMYQDKVGTLEDQLFSKEEQLTQLQEEYATVRAEKRELSKLYFGGALHAPKMSSEGGEPTSFVSSASRVGSESKHSFDHYMGDIQRDSKVSDMTKSQIEALQSRIQELEQTMEAAESKQRASDRFAKEQADTIQHLKDSNVRNLQKIHDASVEIENLKTDNRCLYESTIRQNLKINYLNLMQKEQKPAVKMEHDFVGGPSLPGSVSKGSLMQETPDRREQGHLRNVLNSAALKSASSNQDLFKELEGLDGYQENVHLDNNLSNCASSYHGLGELDVPLPRHMRNSYLGDPLSQNVSPAPSFKGEESSFKGIALKAVEVEEVDDDALSRVTQSLQQQVQASNSEAHSMKILNFLKGNNEQTESPLASGQHSYEKSSCQKNGTKDESESRQRQADDPPFLTTREEKETLQNEEKYPPQQQPEFLSFEQHQVLCNESPLRIHTTAKKGDATQTISDDCVTESDVSPLRSSMKLFVASQEEKQSQLKPAFVPNLNLGQLKPPPEKDEDLITTFGKEERIKDAIQQVKIPASGEESPIMANVDTLVAAPVVMARKSPQFKGGMPHSQSENNPKVASMRVGLLMSPPKEEVEFKLMMSPPGSDKSSSWDVLRSPKSNLEFSPTNMFMPAQAVESSNPADAVSSFNKSTLSNFTAKQSLISQITQVKNKGEKEFFKLLYLSIILNMPAEDQMKLLDNNPNELYYRAKKQYGLKFNQFQEWIRIYTAQQLKGANPRAVSYSQVPGYQPKPNLQVKAKAQPEEEQKIESKEDAQEKPRNSNKKARQEDPKRFSFGYAGGPPIPVQQPMSSRKAKKVAEQVKKAEAARASEAKRSQASTSSSKPAQKKKWSLLGFLFNRK